VSLYRVARALVLSLCKVVFRVRVRGRELVPPSGPYIVAPTHRSILDVPFAAFVTPRTIRFLAKEELFSTSFGSALFTALGAVKVERGTADRGALRALEAALREGSPVAVFPEGTRGSGPRLGPLFGGAGYLAVKLGVPIVPVGIGGSEDILPKGKLLPRLNRVAVVVGNPIRPPKLEGGARRAAAAQMTQALGAELQRVFTDALLLAD
jgi:1-acyl-sn-glycerol-3-phosphate acyltransferase